MKKNTVMGVLIIGDSHAVDLFGMVISRFQDPFIVGITKVGCRPHDPQPSCQYEAVRDFLAERPNIFGKVIFEQAGFHLMRDSNGGKGTRNMFYSLPMHTKVEGIGLNYNNIELVYSYLADIGQHTNVTWLGPRVEPHVPDNFLLKNGCERTFELRPGQYEFFKSLDAYLHKITTDRHQISYSSQIDLLRLKFSEDMLSCEGMYFLDADHYSALGELKFGKRLPENFLKKLEN